jgi:soluble lytic murein transglycosylase-like protein
MLIRIGLSAALFLCISLPAEAQIYAWRDANGNLVVSDSRLPAGDSAVTSYKVPGAEDVRATRPVSLDRSQQYEELILEHAQKNGIRAGLVRAVIQVESAFNPYATSPKGALGLMQLMPATIQQFRVKHPFSPAENIRAGVAYLRELLDRYAGNEELALAAYNAGPGAVDKHGQNIPPYRETRQYVSRVSAISRRTVKVPGSQIYLITETIDGREYTLYSTDPTARINPDALQPSDPSAHTAAQVLQSSTIFQAR